jgi:molybdate transport system permease protein
VFDAPLDPFRVSLLVTVFGAAFCIAVGTPAAWFISRRSKAVNSVLSSLVLLPLVLPPTALGYYLLYGLGRQSAFGDFLIDDLGIRLVFTVPGAALAAALTALPLYIRTAQAGFEGLDEDLLLVATTMSAPVKRFFRVVLPLCWPSLAAATLIAAARAFGEFGATVIVAANIPGETQTVPAAIYDAIQAGDRDRANALALWSLGAGLFVMAVLAYVFQRQYRR